MSQQGRQIGLQTAERCFDVLARLREFTNADAAAPAGLMGKWRALPVDVSMAAFAANAFPGLSVSTVRNWAKMLSEAGVYANVGTSNNGQYVVCMDTALSAEQLMGLMNKSDDDVQRSADEVPASPAPAGMELAQAQDAGIVPVVQALSGLVERPLVTAAGMEDVWERASRTARLLEELKERRISEPKLRAQLAAAEALIAQYEQRIAEMTAELELARSVPTLPTDIVEMAARVDSLLDELDIDAAQ